MNRTIFFVLAAFAAITFALTDCSEHPFRGYILANHKIQNKGLTCIVNSIEKSGCFQTTTVRVADMFVADNAPVPMSSHANPICSNIKNTCIAADKGAGYLKAWEEYATVYRTAVGALFEYLPKEDVAVAELMKQLRDYLLGLFKDHEEIQSLVDGLLDVEKLTELVKEVVTIIFNEIEKFVEPLITGLNPLWEGIANYAKGMSCIVADADFDFEAAKDASGKIQLSDAVFNIIGQPLYKAYMNSDIGTGSAGKVGEIRKWIDDLREQILEYYSTITDKVDAFVEKNLSGIIATQYKNFGGTSGLITQLLKFDVNTEIQTLLSAPKIFRGIESEFFDCLFPAAAGDYCVPFLDQIKWIINGISLIFQGDFAGFARYFKEGFAASQRVVVTASEVAALADIPTPKVAKGGENGIDLVEIAGSSNVSIDTNGNGPNGSQTGEKMITLFGKEFEQKLVFMAAGGAGAFLILMIICCACCCKSKPSYPPMMGGMPPMGMAPSMGGMGMAPSMGGMRGMAPSMGGMRGPPSFGGPARGSMGMRGRPF